MNEIKAVPYVEVDFSRISESKVLGLLNEPPFRTTECVTANTIYRGILLEDYTTLIGAVETLKKSDPTTYELVLEALEEDGRKGIIRLVYSSRNERA